MCEFSRLCDRIDHKRDEGFRRRKEIQQWIQEDAEKRILKYSVALGKWHADVSKRISTVRPLTIRIPEAFQTALNLPSRKVQFDENGAIWALDTSGKIVSQIRYVPTTSTEPVTA